LIHISILFCIFASITNPDMLDTVLTNQSVDSITQPASPVPKEIAYPPMISDANKKYHTFFMEFPSMVEFKKHNTMLNTTEVFTNNNRHRMPSKLHDKSVGILVTCCSSLMTLMLIYGCLYDKASYLMPYFSIKVFQIVISSLSTLGFYSSLPDVKHQLKLASNFPFKDLLMTYDRHTLELIIFGFFLSTILVKLFVAINVWYCYRQLMTLEAMYDQENYAFRNASNGYVAGLEMAFTENEKGSFTSFENYGSVCYYIIFFIFFSRFRKVRRSRFATQIRRYCQRFCA
jgi:hypothetical protein